MTPRLVRYSLVLAALVGLAGCRHVGPDTITDDRLAYNEAIATSWKEQALLNIVRVRYYDPTEFVDVSSITNSYQHDLTGSATIGSMLFPNDPVKHMLSPGLTGGRSMSDRPTITYTPQFGSEFTRNLVSPIPAVSIFNFIESGMPGEVILGLAVESINGIQNRQIFGGTIRPADPEFERVIRTLTAGVASGQISLRVAPGTEKASADLFLTIHDDKIDSPTLAAELAHLRQVLRLAPDVRELKVVPGLLPQAKNEIALRMRSVLRIMTYLCIGIQVPASHLAEGRAHDIGNPGSDPNQQFTVHSDARRPKDCYAAVCYQGYWFWIDSRDANSKRAMLYLKRFLALADTGPKTPPPVLTIRAN